MLAQGRVLEVAMSEGDVRKKMESVTTIWC